MIPNNIDSDIENLKKQLSELEQKKRIYDENPMLYLEEHIQSIRYLKNVTSKDIIQTIIQYLNGTIRSHQENQTSDSL